MIKQKDILTEISQEFSKTIKWSSPPGTPDEVIDVIHRIIAVAMKNMEQGQKSMKYWNIFMTADGGYVIKNPQNFSVWLGYMPKNKMWFGSSGTGKVKTLDKYDVDLVIKNWMM